MLNNQQLTSQIGFVAQNTTAGAQTTFLARSFVNTDGSVTITNGNGATGNPVINLAPGFTSTILANAMAIASLKI